MEGGRIIARGEADALIEIYLRTFVAEGDSGELPSRAHSISTGVLSVHWS